MEEIYRLLGERGLTLSIAESCTGGLLSHMVTNVPGSSTYFKGSVVSYSKEVKVGLLRIGHVIDRYGQVSRQTAEAMALAVRQLMESDIGLSTTGVVGPERLEGMPVGLVYMSVSSEKGISTEEHMFSGSREEMKLSASQAALRLLRRHLKAWD